MDLLQEYSELKKTIDYHMDRYYNQDEPEISDYEYDKLMIRLKEIEKEHPEWVTSDSPSQKIGGTVKREAGVKVTHNVPMLSIEDVFSEDAVCAWIDRVHAMHPDCTFSVETKIDGLSMSLRYVKEADGKLHLQLAETRGDGLIGEDVTANARVVGDVLQVIDLPYDSLELRGEVYMSHEDFEKYNEEQERLEKKTAANPRNLAAGTLRQLDTSITKKRGLKMFIFNVQDGPDEIMESHGRGMDILKAAGVPVVYHKICKTKEEVVRAIDEIGRMREELPYDIDGAVVKIDHIAFRQEFPASNDTTKLEKSIIAMFGKEEEVRGKISKLRDAIVVFVDLIKAELGKNEQRSKFLVDAVKQMRQENDVSSKALQDKLEVMNNSPQKKLVTHRFEPTSKYVLLFIGGLVLSLVISIWGNLNQ